jgi:hypothetical protein
VSDEFEAALDEAGPDRRAFLKRVAIGSAFAVPVVASFSMSGVQAVYAQSTTSSGAVSAGGVTATTGGTTTTTVAPNQTPSTTTTSFTNTTLPPSP